MTTPEKNPGSIISAGLAGAEGGQNLLQKLMSGTGNTDFSSMLGKGFDGLKNVFTNFLQKIADLFNGNLHSLGNDQTQSLPRAMAQITGTNPNITEVLPSGATRDLGRAADIGRTPEFDPQGMDRGAKLKTPSLATPSLNMGSPS